MLTVCQFIVKEVYLDLIKNYNFPKTKLTYC